MVWRDRGVYLPGRAFFPVWPAENAAGATDRDGYLWQSVMAAMAAGIKALPVYFVDMIC